MPAAGLQRGSRRNLPRRPRPPPGLPLGACHPGPRPDRARPARRGESRARDRRRRRARQPRRHSRTGGDSAAPRADAGSARATTGARSIWPGTTRDLEDAVERMSQEVAPPPAPQPAAAVSIEEIFNFDKLIDQLLACPASAAEGGYGATAPELADETVASEGGPELVPESSTSVGGPAFEDLFAEPRSRARRGISRQPGRPVVGRFIRRARIPRHRRPPPPPKAATA